MKQFIRFGLKAKFLVPTIALFVIAMGVSTLVSYRESKKALEEAMIEQITMIADATFSHFAQCGQRHLPCLLLATPMVITKQKIERHWPGKFGGTTKAAMGAIVTHSSESIRICQQVFGEAFLRSWCYRWFL